MERELVEERRWLSRDEMRDGIAVCQSLPGPLAIQVGIFISYLRGGFWGAWAGGWAFILPNFIIVSALGALYVHFSGLPILTESRRDRADSPLVLSAREARHGGLAAMGDRGCLFPGDSSSSS
jgi:hypothetical protein